MEQIPIEEIEARKKKEAEEVFKLQNLEGTNVLELFSGSDIYSFRSIVEAQGGNYYSMDWSKKTEGRSHINGNAFNEKSYPRDVKFSLIFMRGPEIVETYKDTPSFDTGKLTQLIENCWASLEQVEGSRICIYPISPFSGPMAAQDLLAFEELVNETFEDTFEIQPIRTKYQTPTGEFVDSLGVELILKK